MIRGFCRTNVDEMKREEWPKVFAAVPQKGDWIAAKSGRVGKVCMITHHIRWTDSKYCEIPDVRFGDPYIEVELTNSMNGAIFP